MIVGGSNDGMIVEFVGTRMFLPRPVSIDSFYTSEIPDMVDIIEPDVYEFFMSSDRSGPTQGRRYVLRSHVKGLVT